MGILYVYTCTYVSLCVHVCRVICLFPYTIIYRTHQSVCRTLSCYSLHYELALRRFLPAKFLLEGISFTLVRVHSLLL